MSTVNALAEALAKECDILINEIFDLTAIRFDRAQISSILYTLCLRPKSSDAIERAALIIAEIHKIKQTGKVSERH